MIRLGVNIDHVATIRQARGGSYPDPVQAAVMAELGGADNITVHLREDRRHIQDRDVRILKETIHVPLNFEMACTPEMIQFARSLKPHAVTLVPEKREERTTEGGLDLSKNAKALAKATDVLRADGIAVSLFVEPSLAAVRASRVIAASAVEFHTGAWCLKMDEAVSTASKALMTKQLGEAAEAAASAGLQAHFGHGLNYQNAFWLQHISHAEEANIGHAIVGRAVFVGLSEAVREMKKCLNDIALRPYQGEVRVTSPKQRKK